MDARAPGPGGQDGPAGGRGPGDEPDRAAPDAGQARFGGLTEEEFKRRRRGRSIALAVLLAALVVLFYVITVVRLGVNVMDRPL